MKNTWILTVSFRKGSYKLHQNRKHIQKIFFQLLNFVDVAHNSGNMYGY